VRVHTDATADAASQQIRARAFTYGSHIAFAAGHFQPETPEGKRLLAHEITHVLQQREDTVPRRVMRDGAAPAAGDKIDVKGVPIPGFKFAAYTGTYTRPKGYSRKDEGSKQLSAWRKATKQAREGFAKELGLAEDGGLCRRPQGDQARQGQWRAVGRNAQADRRYCQQAALER
jgi:hypothetical protein